MLNLPRLHDAYHNLLDRRGKLMTAGQYCTIASEIIRRAPSNVLIFGAGADSPLWLEANRGGMSEDRDGAPVFLARNAWELGYVAERNPKVKFSDIRERA